MSRKILKIGLIVVGVVAAFVNPANFAAKFLGKLGKFGVSLAKALKGVAIVAGVQSAASLLAKRPQVPRGFGELYPAAGGVNPRQLLFGQFTTPGTKVFETVTNDNTTLWQVFVLGVGPIAGLDKITTVDGEQLTLSTSTPDADRGFYNLSTAAVTGKYAGNVSVYFRNGWETGDQHVAQLASAVSEWTSSHNLYGLAYVVIRQDFEEERLESALNLLFHGQGLLCYDPTKDTTVGGSGSHRMHQYWTWSPTDNPVNAALSYLLGFKAGSTLLAGMGIDPARLTPYIDEIIASVGVAHEQVNINSGTEPRYLACGMLSSADTHETNLQHLERCIAGHISILPDGVRILAGATSAPTLTFDDSDMIEPPRITRGNQRATDVNTVGGQFANQDNDGRLEEFPAVVDTTALAEDGETLRADMTLPLTPTPSASRRLAQAALKTARTAGASGRRPRTVQAQLGMKAALVRPGDHVTLDLGDRTDGPSLYRVESLTFSVRQRRGEGVIVFEAELREEDPLAWSWSSGDDQAHQPTPVLPSTVYTLPPTGWDQVRDTADGRKPDDYADVTNDSLIDAARSWGFEGNDGGWTSSGTTAVHTFDGWQLTATTTSPAITSPDGLNLDADTVDAVIVRLREISGTPWSFDSIRVYYQTVSDPTWTLAKSLSRNRTLQAGIKNSLTFDFQNEPNWTGTIRRIRIVYADTVGEGIALDDVVIGRVRLPRNTNSNLFGQSYVSEVGAADVDTNSQVGPVILLADAGLEAGESVDYASLEIEAPSTRRGRLVLRFRDASNAIVQDYTGRWVGNVSGYAKSELRNVVIPAGANRFATILEREDGVSGVVGARRPIVDAADAIPRPDVQRSATSNLTIAPYDSGSGDYEMGDQVTDGGDKFIYVSDTAGQSNALSNAAVWRRNADLATNADGVLQGYGVPDSATGSNGDYYYDLGSNLLYVKQSGIWVLWTPVRRNVGALAANDSATTDLIAFRAVTEQGAVSRANFRMGAASPTESVSTSIPIADEFAGEPVLARVSCIVELTIDSGSPSGLMSLTVGSETIDLDTGRLNYVGETRQLSISRYFTPSAGTFTVNGTVNGGGGQIEIQAFTAEAVLFKR